MYKSFLKYNNRTDSIPRADNLGELIADLPVELSELFQLCGGYSYMQGLYRVHSIGSSLQWSVLISNYFTSYRGKILPFGFDWLGRQFCASVDKPDRIYMFDPATAEDFELAQSLLEFHNRDLVKDRDNILLESVFYEAMKIHDFRSILFTECVGYKVPLFLSGEDVISNYEVGDIEVYWEFQRQIYQQIKELPEGTPVNQIKFNKKS